jgi:hypothetical protein
MLSIRRSQQIAAAGTPRRIGAHRGNLRPADITNWRVGKMRQRRAAEGTGGGINRGKDCVQRTSQHTSHCAPPGRLRWGNVDRQRTVVPAEDAPHSLWAACRTAPSPYLYLFSSFNYKPSRPSPELFGLLFPENLLEFSVGRYTQPSDRSDPKPRALLSRSRPHLLPFCRSPDSATARASPLRRHLRGPRRSSRL